LTPGGLVPARLCDWVPGVCTITTTDRGYGRIERDRETIARTLVGLGQSPNVYGVIVWGGDPTRDHVELEPNQLAEWIAVSGKPVEVIDPDRSEAASAPWSGACVPPELWSGTRHAFAASRRRSASFGWA
jgi:hypothetical protein